MRQLFLISADGLNMAFSLCLVVLLSVACAQGKNSLTLELAHCKNLWFKYQMVLTSQKLEPQAQGSQGGLKFCFYFEHENFKISHIWELEKEFQKSL